MKKFIVIIAAGLLILLATTLYFEAKLEREVRQAMNLVSQVAQISYDNINVGFDGSIAIKNVEVIHATSRESVSIGLIKVSSSDPFYLLFKSDRLSLEQLPDEIRVDIAELEFNADVFEQFNPEDECGSIEPAYMYSHIGYDRIVLSGFISADFSDLELAVVDSSFADQVSIVDSKVIFSMLELSEAALHQSMPPVEEVYTKFKLVEDSRRKLVEYCASEMNIKPEEFLEFYRHPDLMKAHFGADMGPEVGQAFVEFASGQGDLELTFQPSNQLDNYAALEFYEPYDILRWLNPSVKIDGRDVVVDISEPIASTDSKISAKERSVDTQESGEAKPDKPAAVIENVVSADARAIRGKSQSDTQEPSYHPVRVASAKRYVDKYIRIKRTGGKRPLTGWLDRIEDGKLVIQVSRYGSRVSFQVSETEISSLEVYK